ncbi:MAG: KpsF/GutQ family sugar-phosphate isomerase [Holosporaceae bacterium]|jgi:arabinose-5-phosphate isomerase|nr:KpsF/GutQ family sugar-phosphate isomerase [Holosporaceae bacterium]
MGKIDELEYARSVISKEIAGLTEMRDGIDESFRAAVDLIYGKEGHVIVSGMGKPGHVGRKISATLSSTGTPSFFLHPAEASHGDLGVISQDDVLLVLSFSGNTQELFPMLGYVNRFGIDVIGITSNPDSELAKSSKVCIIIPSVHEACPHNLAPTTSTTIMIAIGDALALCLLKRKDFDREDFKKLHPGGALGKRLLLVKDLMHLNIPLVQENDLMKSVLVEMSAKSFGCAFVIDNVGKIAGIITDGDLRRKINRDFLETKARDVMTRNPKIVSPDTFAQEATKMMNDNKIICLIVSENDYPCGIIHIHDCLRAGLA